MAAVTYQQVIELVITLPVERLPSLYDFARFLKEASEPPVETGDLFGESLEEAAADEAWWDEQFERSEAVLLRLAEETVEEYQAGTTTPLEFNPRSRRQ